MIMKPVDVLVAHPLKHHVFPLAAGIQRSGASMRLITPFYRKGLGRIVAALPGSVGKKASGYHHEGLDERHIISPVAWQARKLRRGSDSDALVREFDAYMAARITRGALRARVLVTMQDYLPASVRAARSAGMRIWSDQILNSSRCATDRISAHYEMAGIKQAAAHDESTNDAILSIADIVTVPSRYALSGIADRVRDSTSLHVIPYGVDHNRFDIKKQKTGDAIRVIARANNVRKGGHLLLEALMKCGGVLRKLAHGQNIEVVILGTMEPALGERLRGAKFPLGMTVRSAVVPHMSMPDVLASADLFVMPSLSESMSLICIEAMRAGLPLVITPYCGIDCFEHLEMGVETSGRASDLAECLMLAFRHADQWPEWGRRAAQAADALSWRAYQAAVSAVARDVVSSC
jgi:glycosyltransferase involved in cell wall biosynthesis